MKSTLFTALVVLATVVAHAQTKWNIDKTHTDIRFTVIHMMVSEVDGEFKDFEGSVSSPTDDFAGSTVEFIAKVASINTDNEGRDKHLKGDDFFNAEAYPEVKFKGKIEKKGKKYYLVGDFTMRDVTKPIRFDVAYNGQIATANGKKAGFKVTGKVNRMDYGLKWNRALEAGGVSVSPEVTITCNVELNQAK